jgi:hypothetical protein
MKTIYYFFMLCSFFTLLSCSEEKPTSIKSYEITIEKDTINLTDFNGLRQGKWIITTNGVSDTLLYKDGVEQ